MPGDKSCSHRAAMLASLSPAEGTIDNFAPGEDCARTLHCLARMGVQVHRRGTEVRICGRGGDLVEPDRVLDCGNSGTTMRLLAGLLSGQHFHAVLSGDASLNRRPMRRVVDPLNRMGADIRMRSGAGAPLSISDGSIAGGRHCTEVASAQVKSAILLAGLYASSDTEVLEPGVSRDHTERMLDHWGVPVTWNRGRVRLDGGGLEHLCPPAGGVRIPGDFSSAAFLMAAALMVPGSDIVLRNVGVNPTRTGMLDVLELMGADVQVVNRRSWAGEPVADIHTRCSSLRPFEVGEEMIPTLIDEVPVLALLAAHASGVSAFRGVGELRVKETDRLAAVEEELGALGVRCWTRKDTLSVEGSDGFTASPAVSDARGDHRMAMTLALAGLPDGRVRAGDGSSVRVSYPQFFRDMQALGARTDSGRSHLRLGLLGENISESASPPMLRAALRARALPGSYDLFDVRPGDLRTAVQGLRALGIRQFNVTRPHKVAIRAELDRLASSARRLGAVNTVTEENGALVGHNTDAYGVTRALREAGSDPAGARVLLLGAGGAARAALFAVLDAGAGLVHIANRSPEKAAHLAALALSGQPGVKVQSSSLRDIPEGRYDLVIQATPVGTAGVDCPLPEHCELHPEAVVFEMIYRPVVTPLVRRARSAGAEVVYGAEMLLHQGARAFELWTGESAPVEKMRETLGRVLRW